MSESELEKIIAAILAAGIAACQTEKGITAKGAFNAYSRVLAEIREHGLNPAPPHERGTPSG